MRAFRTSSGDHKATYLAKSTAPDRLEIITDPLGTVTSLTFKALSDDTVYQKGGGAAYPKRDFRAPMYVVSEVSRDDGAGGQAKTTYFYEGAKIHVQGRGFLGFKWIDSEDLQTGNVTASQYNQDFPYTGRVNFTETYLATGATLKKLTNTWDKVSLNTGTTFFPYVAQSVAESFEVNDGPGNSWVTKVTTDNTYDNHGNPTLITVTSEGAGETFVTETANTYTNDTANWHLGRLTRAEVTNTLPDTTAQTRVSSFDYDPVTGLLTQEVIEPDRPAFTLTTDYAYDAFGNQTSGTVSGPDITARTSTSTYDTDGRFPEVTTNALGHSESTLYDHRFGTPISQTGPNGITTTWDYDGFGRKIMESRADGSQSEWFYEFCDASNPCPAGGVYLAKKKEFDANGAISGPIDIQYFDALNRVFRGETEGFDGTPVYSDTVFNARGEVEKVSRSYFDGDTPQWITTSSDDIGRTLTVTLPNGCTTENTYDGLTTTAENCIDVATGVGQTETRTNDALGRLAMVNDNDGATVTYAYDHFGNLIETNAGGVVTLMTYDIRGRKTSMDDPDMGVWTYAYNVLGELVFQTDAKGQSVTMAYDLLGRMETRVEAEGTTTWTYDTAFKGIGKLTSVSRTQDDYAETPAYDSLGRPESTAVTYEGESYLTSKTYDLVTGRLDTLTYPADSSGARFAVQQLYNGFGYLEEVIEFGGAGTVYWRAIDVDAEGKVTDELLGNGLTTLRDFDPASGLVRDIQTGDGVTLLQDLAFQFDQLGNLTSRSDRRQDRREDFTYDGLNRLTGAAVIDTLLDPQGLTPLAVTDYTYDALGNLTSKSDVGAYAYGLPEPGEHAGPHAVTAVSGINKAYAYDANGAMTSTKKADTGDLQRSVSWSSFNKPVHIQDHINLAASDFVYGPSRARIKQTVFSGSAATKTITYIGGFERHASAAPGDELVHYIRAGATLAIYTKVDDGSPATDKTRYLHKDHLGSITLLSDEAGLVAERRAFDPHGRQRNADWSAAGSALALGETKRGFTGHEHIDSVGLIHMNGRVYDPEIGRFLSADPFVQAPENLQSFNRYTYVNNNPLSYTDPSGFFFKHIANAIAKAIKPLLDLIAKYWMSFAQIALAAIPGYGIFLAAAFTGIMTAINGGSLTDVIMAAGISLGTSYAFAGLHNFQPAGALGKIVKVAAHGTMGGVSSKLRGGSFKSGFLSSAAVQGFTQAGGFKALGLDSGNAPDDFGERIQNAAASAVIGGTSSVIGGGKFANGAVTGAFSRLFNDELTEDPRDLERNERHELGVQEAIRDYQAKGYVLVEARPVAVDITGFLTPRFYDFIVFDPVAGVNLGIEVKTTVLDVIFLRKSQVDKDLAVIESGGITRRAGIPINGVGYQTYCFACETLDTRSIRLYRALVEAQVPFSKGSYPGSY